jgi:hypothetical protein
MAFSAANGRKKLHPEVQLQLKALRKAARDARKLSIITGTPFWVMRKGKLVNLNKGRKQTAKQRELLRLMRPWGV